MENNAESQGNILLSSCLFSDLYVGTNNKPPVIRGLEYRDGEEWIVVNGVKTPPKALHKDIAILFKNVLAESKRTRQDEVFVQYDGVNYRCARIVAPEGVTIRRDDEAHIWCIRRIESRVMDFMSMGMDPKIKRMIHGYKDRRGLLLVSGSFGSGKTTTSSSIFDHWVTTNQEVGVSLEDPPEVSLAKVSNEGTIFQIDLTEKSPEEAIKKLRRWAPRYVFLGEIRTGEAAQELLQIAQSGPMVLATIHASEPVAAITSLVRFASARMSENDARDMIARTLLGVVYQTFEHKRLKARMLSVGEKDDNGIRTKIRLGDFQRIEEDLERQEKNR